MTTTTLQRPGAAPPLRRGLVFVACAVCRAPVDVTLAPPRPPVLCDRHAG